MEKNNLQFLLCLKRKQFKQQAYKKCAFHYEVFFGNEKEIFFGMIFALFRRFLQFSFSLCNISVTYSRHSDFSWTNGKCRFHVTVLVVVFIDAVRRLCYCSELLLLFICYNNMLFFFVVFFVFFFFVLLSASSHSSPFLFETKCEWIIVYVYAPYVCTICIVWIS